MVHFEFYMLPLRAFRARFGRLESLEGGGKDGGDAPDYTPVAQASKEAAQIGADLGREQLAENKRQYENNMAVAQPIIDQQVALSQQQIAQGDDYYNYGKSTRPVEQAMLYDALGLNSDEISKYNTMRQEASTSARSAWDQEQKSRLADIDAQIANLTAAQTTSSSTSDGLYTNSAGNVIKATAAERPSFSGNIFTDHAGYYSQKRYDRAMAQDPKDGSILVPKQSTAQPGYWETYDTGDSVNNVWRPSRQAPGSDYEWVKPISNTTTVDNSKAIQDLQAQRAKLAGNAFDSSKVDYSAADAYGAQVMSSSLARQKAADKAIIDEQAKLDEADRNKLTGLIESSDSNIYDQNAKDIEWGVGNAVSDARAGTAQQQNQLIRQGMRYGMSADKLAKLGGSNSLQNASLQVGAANTARTQGLNDTRGRLVTGAQTGMQLRQSDFARNKNYNTADQAQRWGKLLDSVGMTKGMVGASQGAYGLSVSAGNSAVGNQNATSGQYLSGMNAGTGTIMQGKQMQLQGLGQVLGAQTSAYGASSQAAAASSQGTGQIIGAGIGSAAVMI